MAFTKGRVRTSGRKAGTPNKVTFAMKEAIRLAFEGIGGVDAFASWARKNRTAFYKIAARLIPTDMHMSGTGGEPIRVVFGGRYKRTTGRD